MSLEHFDPPMSKRLLLTQEVDICTSICTQVNIHLKSVFADHGFKASLPQTMPGSKLSTSPRSLYTSFTIVIT